MIARALRLLAVGVPGLALWHLVGIGHPYGRLLAGAVGAGLRLWGWRATVLSLETPPGLGLALARPVAEAHEIVRGTVPLAWVHLDTVTAGAVVFAALLAASGLRGLAPARAAVRVAGAAFALFVVQSAGVLGVVAGPLPGGAAILSQAGGILETGATLVAPALAWAWTVAGAGGQRSEPGRPGRRGGETRARSGETTRAGAPARRG